MFNLTLVVLIIIVLTMFRENKVWFEKTFVSPLFRSVGSTSKFDIIVN